MRLFLLESTKGASQVCLAFTCGRSGHDVSGVFKVRLVNAIHCSCVVSFNTCIYDTSREVNSSWLYRFLLLGPATDFPEIDSPTLPANRYNDACQGFDVERDHKNFKTKENSRQDEGAQMVRTAFHHAH